MSTKAKTYGFPLDMDDLNKYFPMINDYLFSYLALYGEPTNG